MQPVAVGEVLQRLVSNCLVTKVQGEGSHSPHASSQTHLQSSIPKEEGWTLLVDFENSFNLMDRSMIIGKIRKHFPQINRWVKVCYGSSSRRSSLACKQGRTKSNLRDPVLLENLGSLIISEEFQDKGTYFYLKLNLIIFFIPFLIFYIYSKNNKALINVKIVVRGIIRYENVAKSRRFWIS